MMWLQKQPVIAGQSNTDERYGDKISHDTAGARDPAAQHNMRDLTLQQHNSSIVPRLLNFFGLTQQPFGVTPDPSFLYLSQTHREALASLVYGIENGRGFLALVAKPGMGKTTLLFHLLEKFRNSARSVFLFQTQCTPREFLQFLFSDLGLEADDNQDFVRMHEQLNYHLVREARAGKRFIILVDEAHNLDASVLETVRLLSNFETPSAKLLQIVLSGQPELGNKLASRDMVQLQQRICSLNRLEPFSAAETEQYIQHRLRTSGYKGSSLLTSDALTIIAEFSKGIPRNINNLCFNALSLAFALQQKRIDANVAREVISDLDISLHSQLNYVANEKVISSFESHTSTANHDTKEEAIGDLEISQAPLDPNLNPKKEVAGDLDTPLPAVEPNQNTDEEVLRTLEVSRSLLEVNNNGKRGLLLDLDAPLPPVEFNHGSYEEVPRTLEGSQSLLQVNNKGKRELVLDLDTPLPPVEPNHGTDEEIIRTLEVSQSLLQVNNNGKREVVNDLDNSLIPSETNQLLKRQDVACPSPKRNGVQPGAPEVFARLSAKTEGRSMPLAEAQEYMKDVIRFLRSAGS